MPRSADDADDDDDSENDVCGDLRVEIGSCRRARAAARLLPTALALPPRLLVVGTPAWPPLAADAAAAARTPCGRASRRGWLAG